MDKDRFMVPYSDLSGYHYLWRNRRNKFTGCKNMACNSTRRCREL